MHKKIQVKLMLLKQYVTGFQRHGAGTAALGIPGGLAEADDIREAPARS